MRIPYPEGTLNFIPYLKNVQQGTEVIYCVGTPLEVGLMARQRWQMGYTWPICQIGASLDYNIMVGMGQAARKPYRTSVSDYPCPGN